MLEDTKNYRLVLDNIKKQIQEARVKASLAVNRELVQLYWNIGKEIVERQTQDGWGTSVIERLGKDLQNAFPGIKGFSSSNIFRMRKFFLFCQKVAQAEPLLENVAIPLELLDIPWRHNIVLIGSKLFGMPKRL
jgi:predicted nuclease of restriction endonuclease-like (RecB) superfamily